MTIAELPLTLNGDLAFDSAETTDGEAGNLLGTPDRPQRGLLDSAAVGHKDDLRGGYVKKALEVPGLEPR